jgi:homoaconitase/3-isopropylmalate dehydratase large subunit
LRSTVKVTSGSTEGADGLNVTADQETCTEPYVGLVAFGVGAVSVATVPLLAPEPELLQ